MLRAAFDEYGKVLDANFPKYGKKRRAALKRLLGSIGDKPLDQVSALDVERFKRDRRAGTDGKARQPATVNRDLEILKTFFRWAVAAFDLHEHHAKIVRSVKKFREATERVRSLATAEEFKLLGNLNVWAGRVTRVALLTGMRQGELLGPRKTSVGLQHGTLTLTDTKSREPRVVFLDDQAAGLVRDAIAASRVSTSS